ncbi:hypothetical protein C3B47_01785 [Flavobacterium columnare]|uniref:hypothetical protein n=1 Tax=Flavobacterium columnare TaxID=996 RepID=UPI000980999B|nr:hypothetical protein [Flavobacterium columnare]MBF6651649.1 hypothetical protein [Flavobacterium columnare]OOB82481.1 hypothetical protein BZL53_08995 [Flavobacterium columnare]
MTYNEAVSLKNAVGDSYVHEGRVFKPRVVPSIQEEEFTFIDLLKKKSVSENEMIALSSNNLFKVVGFCTEFYENL